MKAVFTALILLAGIQLSAQGIVAGTVADDGGKFLAGATVTLQDMARHNRNLSAITDRSGFFTFSGLGYAYYQLRISYVGFQPLTIDSINVRAERSEFNLSDLQLKPSHTAQLNEVIVYAEKPVIESKDGNVTFNAAESPLSNGSSASDLLETLPLVTKDPDGKVLVAGKEPKILIDEKPVNLNMQQLQDLLETLPGTSIEKIEVMTNPPPQWANEEGGVINIVTKKGVVGTSGRVNVFAGSRGEKGGNLNFNYRKSGLVFNINGGLVDNRFRGNGYSVRENRFADSTTHLNTNNHYLNNNTRPNLRLNMDYDVSKFHSLNLVLQWNGNRYDNNNQTDYKNRNRYDEIYKQSERDINNVGENDNKYLSLNYQLKTNRPGEVLKFNSSFNFSHSTGNRNFYQQFFTGDHVFTGVDSTQLQNNDDRSSGYHLQLNYDMPLSDKKTFLSFGSALHGNRSNVNTEAYFKKKPEGTLAPLDLLSNRFHFLQYINNYRFSLRRKWDNKFMITTGLTAEQTNINFELLKTVSDTSNQYWTYLPFATISKSWNDALNLRLSYKRSIRRPGIWQLNPTVDFSDPYNVRFGNPALEASTAHNFDLVLSRSNSNLFLNLGLGYNRVQDIFSQIRTLQPDGKTEITWQNISGRKEYQLNTWNGYNINKKIRLNFNASYTYNKYSDYDKQFRNFRDGSSFNTNLHTSYNWHNIYSASMNLSLNRWANPQGTVRNRVRMNMGVQAKMLDKKLVVSLNAIDPFTQQENRFASYGKNFTLESYNFTNTKNFRISVSYNLVKTSRPKDDVIKKAQQIGG